MPSTDATLSGGTVTGGGTTLVTFASDTTTYTASVANSVDEVTVAPTTNHASSTVEYLLGDAGDEDDLEDADDMEDGFQVPLAVGANRIVVSVIAEDGTTYLDYVVTVTRAAGSTAPVWSTTMTVGVSGGHYGYSPDQDRGTLNDDDFEYGSPAVEYTVNRLSVGTKGVVQFTVNKAGLPTTDTLTLELGGHEFPFSARTLESGNRSWSWDSPTALDDPATEFPVGATATVCLRTATQTCPAGRIDLPTTLPTLSIDDVSATEGDPLTFTVTLSAESDETVTVVYATADDTGISPSDYTNASDTLTFAAGVTTQTITVATTEDTTVESSETITVLLSNATNATISDDTGTGTIIDDDGTANNAPVFDPATATREVPENSAVGTSVGAVIPEATPADSGDTLTYSLEGTDAASFDFDASARQIKTKMGVTYNHEATKNTYSVDVKASDGTDSGTLAVTINVTDADEKSAKPDKPTVTVVPDLGSVKKLGVTWMKPDLNGGPDIVGYEVQYREGTSGTWRTWPHTGTGTTATITALKASTEYQVQVRANNDELPSDWSDPSDAVRTEADTTAPGLDSGDVFGSGISIRLTFNEQLDLVAGALPSAAASAFTLTVDGNTLAISSISASANGILLSIVPSSTIFQGQTVVVSYDRSVAGTDAIADAADNEVADFTTGSGGVPAVVNGSIVPACTLNTGDLWCGDLTVRAIDTEVDGFKAMVGGLSDTTFSVGTGNYTIDQVTVDNSTATNPGSLLFSLTGGLTTVHKAKLVLHVGSSQLAFSTATYVAGPQSYVWNSTGLDWSSTSLVTLRLRAPNNAPVFADATDTRDVEENSAAGTDVGAVVTATDMDSGDTLTYSLEGTDAASFDIDDSSGQIQTVSGEDYNFEATKNSYSVTVKASDGLASDTIAVTINVTDANEKSAKPAKPTLAAVSASSTSLTASWTKPGLNDGPDITGYALEYREAPDGTWEDFAHFRHRRHHDGHRADGGHGVPGAGAGGERRDGQRLVGRLGRGQHQCGGGCGGGHRCGGHVGAGAGDRHLRGGREDRGLGDLQRGGERHVRHGLRAERGRRQARAAGERLGHGDAGVRLHRGARRRGRQRHLDRGPGPDPGRQPRRGAPERRDHERGDRRGGGPRPCRARRGFRPQGGRLAFDRLGGGELDAAALDRHLRGGRDDPVHGDLQHRGGRDRGPGLHVRARRRGVEIGRLRDGRRHDRAALRLHGGVGRHRHQRHLPVGRSRLRQPGRPGAARYRR